MRHEIILYRFFFLKKNKLNLLLSIWAAAWEELECISGRIFLPECGQALPVADSYSVFFNARNRTKTNRVQLKHRVFGIHLLKKDWTAPNNSIHSLFMQTHIAYLLKFGTSPFFSDVCCCMNLTKHHMRQTNDFPSQYQRRLPQNIIVPLS